MKKAEIEIKVQGWKTLEALFSKAAVAAAAAEARELLNEQKQKLLGDNSSKERKLTPPK